GSLLSEKQGIQWMIADSTMELYQGKLMVLHAAYRIDRGLDFTSEVSMAKHFVANALGRIIDRSIQVHGALGYSPDTPLPPLPARALGPSGRRRGRDPPDADRPAHHRRVLPRGQHATGDGGSAALRIPNTPRAVVARRGRVAPVRPRRH